ncbi:MAG: phenylalanine--tRNA ligase subunit alpha, partial [Alphaproteobacteria bacterium]|nr:phenylalanine--tRNA ligase subunit alpha [Alphaproteobacteria bacterium]
MMSDIEIIKTEIEAQIASAQEIKALDDVRVGALGKKGRITELLKTLGGMPVEERIEFGKKINVIKAELEAKIAAKKQELETKLLNEKLKSEVIDVTLPC